MNGSCLCGAIQYEADGVAGPVVHCHCFKCQKAHAAAFATTARVARSDFRWVEGEEWLGFFESSPGKLRWFCKTCGSHLMAEWLGRPEVIVRVATLDNDPGAVPKAHIWTSHDRPWLASGENIPAYPEKP